MTDQNDIPENDDIEFNQSANEAWDIDDMDSVNPNDKDGDGIDDDTENASVDQEDRQGYADRNDVDIPKKNFWKTDFGRTLRLKNKTGKSIAAGLAGIGSNFFPEPFGGWIGKGIEVLITTQTGVGMEALLDFNVTQLIIMAVAFLLVWALPSIWPGLKEKQAWKVIDGRIDNVADEVVAAVDEKSDGGKKITRTELKDIIKSAFEDEDA